ncbi:DNA replication complex GINS protein PSF3-like [Paramacrobiotus metropolitanus]|uniref:DNA replication complex GINS protein PSF3-like n=1 Tax=Paramacrobiotus metropolitanus TaxID=2943436 RepID=UPI0024460FDB|nr:DNA replication complex GINS protein PSF3-like [Paramacrobiotus metropolitanus]
MRDVYLGTTHESYLSLNDIMVTEEKISCSLRVDFAGLGYIHPNSASGDLLATPHPNVFTVLDLPLWMAQALYDRRHVEVRVPKAYQEDARRILKADPGVVDLRKECTAGAKWRFSENYYALGLYVIPMSVRDRTEIQKSLTDTFIHRFRKIFDWSNSTHRDILSQYTNRLDRSEVQLLKTGKAEQTMVVQWLERKSKVLKASTLVKESKTTRPPPMFSERQVVKRARV